MKKTTRTGSSPTIEDVAALAAVSKGTVSNVLNGRVRVSGGTRARVEDAIRALDYKPAETARSLTSRRRSNDVFFDEGTKTPRLTTVGYVSVDYIASLGHLPAPRERSMASEIVKAVGGPAANVAAIAAGIGGKYTVAASIITAIGSDQDSDWAMAELASRRVRTLTPIERPHGRLSRALVLVEKNGERTIISEPLNLGAVQLAQFLETTDRGGRTWCLHFEGYQIPHQFEHIRRAREKGYRVTMQATGLPSAYLEEASTQLFEAFDVMMLHRETLLGLPGAPTAVGPALEWLSRRVATSKEVGPEVIIVTLGREGAALVQRDGKIVTAIALPVDVVDLTGAGDALIGSFLAFWLNGAEADFALQYACAAASLAVSRLGAQEVRPSASQLTSALRRYGLSHSSLTSSRLPVQE